MQERHDYTMRPKGEMEVFRTQDEMRELFYAGYSNTHPGEGELSGEDMHRAPEVLTQDEEIALMDSSLENTLSVMDVNDRDRYFELVNLPMTGRAAGVTYNTKIDLMKLAFHHMQGISIANSASLMRVNMAAIQKAKNSAQFKTLLAMLTQAAVTMARTYISASVIRATKVMASLLRSDNEKIKFAAARDILDRAGLKPVEVSLVHNKSDATNMSDNQLIDIMKRALEEGAIHDDGSEA